MRAMVLVLVCVAGCSHGDDDASTTADGAHLLGDGASSQPNSDGGTSEGPGPGADLATPPSYAGYGTVFVTLTRGQTAGTPYSATNVGAIFYQAVTSTSSPTCSSTTIGTCVVTSCSGTGSATPPTEPAAGVVTIAGPGHTVTLNTGLNSHETQSTPTLWWTGGETLAISSTGATVPGFDDSLQLPEQIVVSAPYLPEQGNVQITRAAGLSLEWQGGVHGEAIFTLAQGNVASSVSATCRYPAAQASAVMPSSVLSMFPAGVAAFSGSTQNSHAIPVGGYLVTVNGYFNGVYDTGRYVAGHLQLD